MPARKEFPPEQLERARYLYEQTLAPVSDIASMLAISRHTFYTLARAQGWRPRRVGAAQFQFARALMDTTAGQQLLPPAEPMVPLGPERRAEIRSMIAARIFGLVERELDALECVVTVLRPTNQAEAERCARTLASIARSTRELAALNAPEDVTPPDDDDEREIIPVDIEQLRDELARRLRGLAEQQSAERLSGPLP